MNQKQRIENLEKTVKWLRILLIVWAILLIANMMADAVVDRINNEMHMRSSEITRETVTVLENLFEVATYQSERIDSLEERLYKEIDDRRINYQYLKYVAGEVEDLNDK